MARGRIERRGTKPRRAASITLIITEGEKSEATYFSHFRTRKKNIEIRIVSNSKNGGKTDYMNLIRKALRIQKDDGLSIESGDSIWIVADGDVNYQAPDAVNARNNALNHARSRAAKEKITLIVSNPCFEIWYLLHKRYTTAFFPDFDSMKGALERVGIANYEKNVDLFTQLQPDLSKAIANAKKLESHHEEDGFTLPLPLTANPYTEVYLLVEALYNEGI